MSVTQPTESTPPELLPCPLCPDGGKPYFTRSVNGSKMLYVGCSQCGLELKAMLVMVTPIDEQPSKDIVALWNTRASSPAQAENAKFRQALGWILDAADAAYNEDSENTRIHEIFNIVAQATGVTRRLPDEYQRFDESSPA